MSEIEGKYVFRERSDRKIGYNTEFRQLMREHTDAVRTATKLMNSFNFDSRRALGTKEQDGVRVRYIKYPATAYGPGVGCFEVNYSGMSYFVKKASKYRPGYKEFRDTIQASEVLKDLPFAEVVQPEFGYTDEEDNNYFVSKWLALPTLDKVLDTARPMLSPAESKVIHEQAEQIRLKLREAGYGDTVQLHLGNMLYDQERKKIIALDLDNYGSLERLKRIEDATSI